MKIGLMLQEKKYFYAFLQNTQYIEKKTREILDLALGMLLLHLGIILLGF